MFPTITGNERPNTPIEWQHARVPLNLAWHHVIPYPLLRDVWNVLVETGRISQLAEARLALRQYLMLCGQNWQVADGWIDQLRAQAMERWQCDALATAAVWHAWNIVEGPDGRLRTDDPGDHYMDRYTHGITLREFERMNAMEFLFGALVMFRNSGVNPPPAALSALREAIMLVRQVLACEQPILYRPDMWERDGGQRWKKRRSGERFIAG